MDFLFHHMLRSSARRFPEKEALVDGARRFNYAQAWSRCCAMARTLRRCGLNSGDRVGVYLPPGMEQALSLFAISRAGGVFVPIHHSLKSQQVQHVVQDCRMRMLVTSSGDVAPVAAALGETPLEHLILVDADDVDTTLPVTRLHEDEGAADVPDADPAVIGKDLAAILYTSGSTGLPKGVMLSHENLIAGASIVSDYLEITCEDRLLAALPFTFDAGLNQLTTAIQQGGTLVLLRFHFPRQIVDALVAERITGLAGVPPLWALLAQPTSQLAQQRPKLRYITNTGGALPLPVLEKLRQALPDTRIYLMYGFTEAFRSTYLPPEELDRRPTSMGKAIPNTTILVVNEKGSLCKPHEVGELVHHGPTVSMGYWQQPELTARLMRPHPLAHEGRFDNVRVCYSGDLVYQDEEGFLFFVGRRDNLIKCSGFRVSPTEVEQGLMACGGLREAAVVGLPDDVLGQRIKAFVVPADGQEVDTDRLLRECVQRLPRHMVPREIEVVAALPKTSSGKVDYPALRGGTLAGSSAAGTVPPVALEVASSLSEADETSR